MTDARVRLRASAAVWREDGGQTVVLQLEQSQYLALNEAGSVLWQALVGGATPAELVGRLTATYDISRDQAAADVEAFLSACRDHDLLEP